MPSAKHIFNQIRYGLIFTVCALVVAALYGVFGGPLPSRMNWAALAVVILVIGIGAVAIFATLARSPNPYKRTYPLYDLNNDVPPEHETLDSGSADLLWQILPAIVAAIILAKFFAHW